MIEIVTKGVQNSLGLSITIKKREMLCENNMETGWLVGRETWKIVEIGGIGLGGNQGNQNGLAQ